MTNRDFQNRLLDRLETGHTVLAETERFVHQVQRAFRARRLDAGKPGWEFPKIHTLSRWLENLWTQGWPDSWPASEFFRWRVLMECLDEAPPPEPLVPDAGLVRLLDESFEHCLRYGVDPGRGEGATPLVEWRRGVWRIFDARLSEAGLFHPAQLPEKVLADGNRIARPQPFAFAGFEFAGHWEKRLLLALQKSHGAEFFPFPGGDATPETLVYSDPDREIIGLMESLLAEGGCAPHEIAVVLLDPDTYGPALSNCLEDLLEQPLAGDRGAYNLCPDLKLSGQPLFHAALLPARFATGGQTRLDLFALLRSPYYDSFARRSRALSGWDRVWRCRRIEAGLKRLLGAVRDRAEEIFPGEEAGLETAMAPLLARGRRPVSHWAQSLRRVWAAFGFPVLANELDQIGWQHMEGILARFESDFGSTAITASRFLEILSAAAARTTVQKKGLEDGGIQVLGSLEARGLAFRKLFVPGMASGVLPQPVRSFPLLSSAERKQVPGGTLESQYAFARALFGNYRACAPQIALSRPAMDRDGEMCLPSPFWPPGREESAGPAIPWKDALPAMQRARWVRQSMEGAALWEEKTMPRTAPGPEDFRIRPLCLPESITVSELQSALLCPVLFFSRHVLGLEELEEPESGVPPLDRGRKIHAIVASFVIRALPLLRAGQESFETLAGLLEQVVSEELEPELSDAAWQVERERLLGGSGGTGLLGKWLEEEWSRLQDGWSWLAVESPFRDMRVGDCAVGLRGRLDRIDLHPEKGIVCWDYKTGSIPGRKEIREGDSQPQLPAYLLALAKGLVSGVKGGGKSGGAGYIDLSSAGKAEHKLFFDPAEEHSDFLAGWESAAAAAMEAILAGKIGPRWLRDERACQEKCAYRAVCGAP